MEDITQMQFRRPSSFRSRVLFEVRRVPPMYELKSTNIASSADTLNLETIREGLPNDLIAMLQDNIFYIGSGVILLVVTVRCRKTKQE